MTSFKTFYLGTIDNILSESQMMDRIKKLKSKQKISFDLKNIKEVDKFKTKLSEMNFQTIVEDNKITIQKP